jgi:hypothetical protein
VFKRSVSLFNPRPMPGRQATAGRIDLFGMESDEMRWGRLLV